MHLHSGFLCSWVPIGEVCIKAFQVCTVGSCSVCVGEKRKAGWGWASTCCGPGNIRTRMPGLLLTCCQAFLESENDQVLSQLSPDWIAWQNSRFLKRTRSLAGLVPGNLMLSVDMRDRTPSQHQVRQVRLYKSKRGNSISIPQTSSSGVSWICGGDWEPQGHKTRVRLSLYGRCGSTTPWFITTCQDAAGVVWEW